MAITGIESLIYGVDNVDAATRFFKDFGLHLVEHTKEMGRFVLPEGSTVLIRAGDDPALPRSAIVGNGVREVIWGVDTPESLDALTGRLKESGVALQVDESGTVRFHSPCGLAWGLRLYGKKQVVTAPDPVNSPGRVNRLNTHRRWRKRAHPKLIQHVVFAVQDVRQSFRFLERYLDFRLSDYQRGYGIYGRADGSNQHHNIFFIDAKLPFPGLDGQVRFHHANFGVEDLDEMMVGANYMARKGWEKSHLGLGRHRIDSALFYYLPCPAGGEAEYGADGDALDDNWVPREWVEPRFGFVSFVHNLPPFLQEEPEWNVRFLENGLPADDNKGDR